MKPKLLYVICSFLAMVAVWSSQIGSAQAKNPPANIWSPQDPNEILKELGGIIPPSPEFIGIEGKQPAGNEFDVALGLVNGVSFDRWHAEQFSGIDLSVPWLQAHARNDFTVGDGLGNTLNLRHVFEQEYFTGKAIGREFEAVVNGIRLSDDQATAVGKAADQRVRKIHDAAKEAATAVYERIAAGASVSLQDVRQVGDRVRADVAGFPGIVVETSEMRVPELSAGGKIARWSASTKAKLLHRDPPPARRGDVQIAIRARIPGRHLEDVASGIALQTILGARVEPGSPVSRLHDVMLERARGEASVAPRERNGKIAR